jgi:hypothetical protein
MVSGCITYMGHHRVCLHKIKLHVTLVINNYHMVWPEHFTITKNKSLLKYMTIITQKVLIKQNGHHNDHT